MERCPLVSVIMPSYNTERFIAKSIDSVLNQTYANWELIISDGPSNDNTAAIVNNYCGGGGGAGMQMAFDAAPTLNNCIFWGNHAFYTTEDRNDRDTIEYYMGSQIWLWGSDCLPMFNNSVVQYGLDTINGYYQIPEDHYNNMLDVNPLFVNEESRDYHLTETSPCVNAGLQDVSGLFIPSFDLDGRQRISGGRIDMGCYESQGFKRLTE